MHAKNCYYQRQSQFKRTMGYVNGFCESDQMESIISSNIIPEKNSNIQPLSSTRIITRFYQGEIPYWNQFIKYHKQLGCKDFLVFVQETSDLQWLERNTKASNINISIHTTRSSKNIHYDEQLKLAETSLIAGHNNCRYQMLIDVDEFYIQSRKTLNAEKIFQITGPGIDQIHLSSILTLRLNQENNLSQMQGTWGHVGRPIAKTEQIEKIQTTHSFKTRNSSSLPAGMLGLHVMHLWTRSFEDCLIKIFSRKLNDFKSAGLETSLKEIRSGELPRRLRLLAFLSLQDFYLKIVMHKDFDFRFERDKDYLDKFLSIDDQITCRTLFEEYKFRLSSQIGNTLTYPSANFPTIIKTLPTLHEMRNA